MQRLISYFLVINTIFQGGRKMKALRIIIAGIIYAVVAQVIFNLGAFLGKSYYTDPNYLEVWSKIMMPEGKPPPASFYVYTIVFSIIGAILYALVYNWIKGGLKGKSIAARGLFYGLILFLVAGVPGFLMLYLLINVPLMLNFMWLI